MPTALKLSETYEDKLTVIFVESQGLTPEEAEAFAYRKQWMGRDAMWTSERPFDTGSRGLPNFALLSNEGKVLLKGHPITRKGEVIAAIDREIARAKKGPDGTPKSLRKAWADFEKGKYKAAVAAAGKIAGYGRDDAAAAKMALALFDERIAARIGRARWMIDNGHYERAAALIGSLAKRTRGLEAHETAVEELKAKLASPDLKGEIAAAKALGKIEKKIAAKGFDAGVRKALEKLAAEKEGTKAADRALHLIAVAEKI